MYNLISSLLFSTYSKTKNDIEKRNTTKKVNLEMNSSNETTANNEQINNKDQTQVVKKNNTKQKELNEKKLKIR